MNQSTGLKRIGKSSLAILLMLIMVVSALPLGAAALIPGEEPFNYGQPQGWPNHSTTQYPPHGSEGYIQLKKAAAWTNKEKTLAEIQMELYGTAKSGAGADAVVVLDRSGSMSTTSNGATNDGSAMWEAKAAAADFVGKMLDANLNGAGRANNNKLGVVSFSTSARTDYGLTGTAGKTGIVNTLLGPSIVGSGMTNYRDGLTQAKNMLTDKSRDRYIIFLTDGGPNEPNDSAHKQIVTDIKNEGITIYCIGFGDAVAPGTNAYNTMYEIASKIVGTSDKHMYTAGSSGLQDAYNRIFTALKLAGNNAKAYDTLDDKFDFDISSTRPVMIDGKAVTEGAATYQISSDRRSITWNIDKIQDQNPGNKIRIPIKLKDQYAGDPGLYPTNKGNAYIDYTNMTGVANCRIEVRTPVLAKPYALIEKVYYEVNEAGEALDYSGGVLNNPSLFDLYQNHLDIQYDQWSANQSPYTSVADDYVTTAKGQYKFSDNAKYNTDSPTNSKTVQVQVLNDNETYRVYYGYRKLKTATNGTLTKTYSEAVPSHISQRADFSLQEVGATTTPGYLIRTGDSYALGTLQEDKVYKVTEKALVGYTPVSDFYIMYDGKGIVLVDKDGNAAQYANVSVNGMNITVGNLKDDSQTHNITYQVKYFIDDVEQTKDGQTVTKNVWINYNTIDVDKSTINTTDKYPGYRYNQAKGGAIPAKIGDGGVIKVHYDKDITQTKDLSYKVMYFLNNEYKETVTVTKPVWVNDDTLPVDPIDPNRYASTGYKLQNTFPAVWPTSAQNGDVYRAFYIPDLTQTKQINYTVKIYLDDAPVSTDAKSATVWKGVDFAKIPKSDVVITLPRANYKNAMLISAASGASKSTQFPASVYDGDVLELYYITDNSTKTVQYYIDYQIEGKTQKTEIGTKEISIYDTDFEIENGDFSTNMFEYYVVRSVTPAVGQRLPVNGTIVVDYEKDLSKTKDFKFTVRYLLESKFETAETFVETVWAGYDEIPLPTIARKTFAGYRPEKDFDSFMVKDGATIEINYLKDNSQVQTINYTVEYYDQTNTLLGSEAKTKDIWVGEKDVTFTFSEVDTTLHMPGNAMFGSVTPMLPVTEPVGDTHLFKVYYVDASPQVLPVTANVTLKGKTIADNMFVYELKNVTKNSVETGILNTKGQINVVTTDTFTAQDIGKIYEFELRQLGLNGNPADAKKYTVLDKSIKRFTIRVIWIEEKQEVGFELVYSDTINFSNTYKAR